MRIGFRTLKTAAGVSISVLIGQLLQLEYFTAAGILTLLCIQKSRKQSIKAAVSRFLACLLGFIISTALFELIGYQPYTILVLLLLFIPLVVALRIQEGLASSLVIMMHVYMNKQMELSFFWNELLIVLIGLGVALVVNWYMPSIDKTLLRYREEADQQIASILHEISNYLMKGATDWDGRELLQLGDTLNKARALALLNAENHTLHKDDTYITLFDQKRQQLQLLEGMLPMVSRITAQMEQSSRIGGFVERLSLCLREGEPTGGLYEELKEIRQYHKQLPLPESREEFENRANLFGMVNELERLTDTL
ncbi:aromatic acid exporter family protein [Paenibacillus protaetiae]|uniref:Aromatic acid exporter family protein n=1 Tax=Paenibacillus protaetiae TaxID=2509456 RepID=A0A4P6EZC5_9BACL|nr:aromatic acid exporter family protein [Paenibacillus protaetiae]QAY68125.1 aromatic acid exporter family protein [Paenibacillus protaetiae]